MKKNMIIGLLIIISFLSLTFGIYQKMRADKIEKKFSNELSIQQDLQKKLDEALKENQRLKVREELKNYKINLKNTKNKLLNKK